jgi:hypothetical protein
LEARLDAFIAVSHRERSRTRPIAIYSGSPADPRAAAELAASRDPGDHALTDLAGFRCRDERVVDALDRLQAHRCFTGREIPGPWYSSSAVMRSPIVSCHSNASRKIWNLYPGCRILNLTT